MNLFRIKENHENYVRTTLCIEDVELKDITVMREFGLMTVDSLGQQEYYVFKDAFKVPRFNVFYASRIKGVDDPYLGQAIMRLLYLNPNPPVLLRRKITEFIVKMFSAYTKVESEVLMGAELEKPVLTWEEVHQSMAVIIGSGVMENYEPDSEDFVLFHRDDKLSKSDKILVRGAIRRTAATEYFRKAIHTATEYLIDSESMVKLSHTRLKETDMILTGNGLASVQTIRKYMNPSTKRVFDEHNQWAPLRSNFSYGKYKEFVALDKGLSADEQAAALKVSKSTIMEYRKIFQNIGVM